MNGYDLAAATGTFRTDGRDCGNQNEPVTSENGEDSALSALSAPTQDADLLAGIRDGAWLDQQVFPPLRYAVDGLIPEGCNILIGPPKAGKSYLLGGLLLAVAAGGYALGKIGLTGKRPVLYLALEDGDRRMQARCRELLDGEPIPGEFYYVTRVQPRQLFALVTAFLAEHPDTALVVLDTLGKIMPEGRPGESAYQRDYRIAGELKALTDAHPGLSLVIVHHDRKAASEDFVDSVSGTNGLAGAADTIMVLARKRQSSEGVLKVTGRDVPESEYALSVAEGQWTLDGSTLAEAAKVAQQRDESAGLGDRSSEALRIVGDNPDGIGPTRLSALMGIEPKRAGELLARLAEGDRVVKTGRGIYQPRAPAESAESAEIAGHNIVNFPHSDG